MYIYVLMSLSITYCLWMVIKLHRIRQHDKVLFRICQLRRDIMKIFREKGFHMKKEDYFAARRLLDSISHGIHHFDTYKASVFNIRELSKLAAMMRKQGIEIDEIPKPKDKEVIEVFKKFEFAKAYAFLTYTPFIKSEILARVFLMVLATCLSFLGKLGWKSLMMAAENLKWAEAQIEHVHQMNNHATV